jgi:hypothetical protein
MRRLVEFSTGVTLVLYICKDIDDDEFIYLFKRLTIITIIMKIIYILQLFPPNDIHTHLKPNLLEESDTKILSKHSNIEKNLNIARRALG